jgi:hypothetical protein
MSQIFYLPAGYLKDKVPLSSLREKVHIQEEGKKREKERRVYSIIRNT